MKKKDKRVFIELDSEVSDIQQYVSTRCQNDSEFKQAWEESQEEFEMTLSMIRARNAANMTQNDLSKATGID